MNENLMQLLSGKCAVKFGLYLFNIYKKRDENVTHFETLNFAMQRGLFEDFFDESDMLIEYSYIRQLGKYQITITQKSTDLHLIEYLKFKELNTKKEAFKELITQANKLCNNEKI